MTEDKVLKKWIGKKVAIIFHGSDSKPIRELEITDGSSDFLEGRYPAHGLGARPEKLLIPLKLVKYIKEIEIRKD